MIYDLNDIDMMTAFLLSTDERKQAVWESALGSAFEVCPWWLRVKFVEGDWDQIGRVALEIVNPDDEMGPPVPATVGIDEIARAYATAVCKGYADACTGHRITLDTLDEGMDSCSSDVVMQIAVLGDVIYG